MKYYLSVIKSLLIPLLGILVLHGDIISIAAQESYKQDIYTIAFYNTETLYDTIRNPLIEDADFTPVGRYRWNTEKYNRKIRNIARVVDGLNADILGLCEIENEAVVRDLMYTMNNSYNYIHKTSRDRRGMDLVLLYRGDSFFPDQIRQVSGPGLSREILMVHGRLLDQPITILICHMPSLMNSNNQRINAATSLRNLLEQLAIEKPGQPIILMGDFNTSPDSRLAQKTIGIGSPENKKEAYLLYTPFASLSRQGFGSYIYRDKRHIYDFICLSSGLLSQDREVSSSSLAYTGDCGIFVRNFMIHGTGKKKGYPIRTFDAGNYIGGYSDHLPVYLKLEYGSAKDQ